MYILLHNEKFVLNVNHKYTYWLLKQLTLFWIIYFYQFEHRMGSRCVRTEKRRLFSNIVNEWESSKKRMMNYYLFIVGKED